MAEKYSIPDQPLRFATGKKEGNARMLDIDSMYNLKTIAGKTVVVTGGNRGLGLAIAQEFERQGANVYITTRQPCTVGNFKVLSGIEVTANDCGTKLAEQLRGVQVDILVNNAGYFYAPEETMDSLNFEEELKMIDICAVGPLRITQGLFKGGNLTAGSKVVMITSQGGSIAWRTTQNPHGHDYGHHMSKAAANMMGVLVAQELKHHGIIVTILHPGFNKTDMTSKYAHIWEIEGAVDSSVGAKRVLYEIDQMTLEKSSGLFINCEDGLQIPW